MKRRFSELANTSSWADRDASNYNVVNSFEDVVPDEWFTMETVGKDGVFGTQTPTPGGIEVVYTQGEIKISIRKKALMRACMCYRTTRMKWKNITDRLRNAAAVIPTKEKQYSPSWEIPDKRKCEESFSAREDVVKPHAVIHAGDVSYADGFAPRWDSFAELSEALFSSVQVVIASGNHDVVNSGMEYHNF